jgi:hypothetical protein
MLALLPLELEEEEAALKESGPLLVLDVHHISRAQDQGRPKLHRLAGGGALLQRELLEEHEGKSEHHLAKTVVVSYDAATEGRILAGPHLCHISHLPRFEHTRLGPATGRGREIRLLWLET